MVDWVIVAKVPVGCAPWNCSRQRLAARYIDQRNAIERRFGAWVSFGGGLGPLPAWVRRFSRVRNWVQAKILVAGARWLFFQEPHKLALA